MQRPIMILVLMLGIALPSAIAQTEKPSPAAVDRYGDPLPDRAIARLGTMRLRHGLSASRIAFAPGGKVLASVGRWPGLCLWDADTGRLLHRCSVPFSAYGAAFSPDGSKLFTGRHLIDVATGKEIRQFKTRGDADSAAFSPDGTTVASARYTGGPADIILWNANTGDELRELSGHRGYVTALAFSPKDSKILVSAGEDKSIRLWNAATGKHLYSFDGHDKPVAAIAFAPDGKVLASVGEEPLVRVWDASTGKPLRQLKLDSVSIYSVAFSPDGKLLACEGAGGIISLWNPETGQEVRKWETHSIAISSIAFAPDGKTLASASSGVIRRWNVETGKEVEPLAAHHGRILSLRYAPDGKTLFSCGEDRKVAEWNLGSNQLSGRLFRDTLGQSGAVFLRAVDLSPDGKILAQAPRVRYADGSFNKTSIISL
ncbi:MAG: hypothetical protein EXR98_01965 [Gemmataceae bacterium]|nr:hypothetical protein [Gemmataceae bacterium]